MTIARFMAVREGTAIFFLYGLIENVIVKVPLVKVNKTGEVEIPEL